MAAELTRPYPVHRPRAARCGSPLPSALAFPEKLKISAPRKGQRKSNKGRKEKERRKHLVPQHLTHPPQYPRCPSTHYGKVKERTVASPPPLPLPHPTASSPRPFPRAPSAPTLTPRSGRLPLPLPALRPTCVEARKSRIAWLHRGSAKRSRIFQRLFHLPVSFLTVLHIIFCCVFHSGQFFRRCSLV